MLLFFSFHFVICFFYFVLLSKLNHLGAGFFGQPQPTLLNNQHQVSAFQHQTMQSSSSTHPIFNQSAAGLVPTASFGSDNSFTNVFGAPPMAAAPVMTTNGNHASNPTGRISPKT